MDLHVEPTISTHHLHYGGEDTEVRGIQLLLSC